MNKRILVFIDWYRPGYKAGGPVTSVANLVDHLVNWDPGNQGHPGEVPDPLSFSILTRNTDYMDSTPYEGIEPDRWIDLGEKLRVCYISPGQLNKRQLRSLAEDAGCETWYINGIYSWYFSILPLLISRRQRPARVIVAPRGMLSPHAKKVKSIKKSLFIWTARLTRLYRGVIFHATNEIEAQAIRDTLGNRSRVKTAPNLPARIQDESLPSSRKSSGSLNLISLARISPEKNTLKALEILSLIKSGRVSFTLIGEVGPADYWLSCQELIRGLPPHIQVEYKGPVHPDELAEVLQQAHILFLPTTGENHGHAILECLSHGLPTLISDQTPWKDLQEKDAGWAFPLEGLEDFAATLLQCLDMDQEAYDKKSRAARKYASEYSENPAHLEMNQMLFSHE